MTTRPSISLNKMLSGHAVSASAPCRIDSGGTWDIKAMALPFTGIRPTTVNIALNLRTSVEILPYSDGKVKISSLGYPEGKVFSSDRLPFVPPFGIFLAAVSYFGIHGIEIRIKSRVPVQSALGGSSTALVALIKALDKSGEITGRDPQTREEILHLAYHMEDAVSGGNCGIQDQAAAVYGGVHQWTWQFGERVSPFKSTPLLDSDGQAELSDRLLVAFSGISHVSSITNKKWINDFLSGKTRPGWSKANEIVQEFARALMQKDWLEAAALLRKEMIIRKKITPEALIPETENLIHQAERAGCGARFSGAGAGGSIWAIGRKKDISQLKHEWEKTLARSPGGHIIECQVDPEGVR